MNFTVGILQALVKLVQVEILELITCSATGTGGSRLSQIFWEHENLSGLSIIRLIYIKLYRKKETKFWKRKSGLSGNPA